MTAQIEKPPAPTTTVVANSHYEPCEECGAPLDAQQRYCVNCAARRGNGANPSSRYFAAMSKKARRPVARPPAKSPTSRAAAVGFFALLPIAVAIGVVVGRSGGNSGENEALLEALRNRPAAVAATAKPGATTTATATKAKKGKTVKPVKGADKTGGKVVAHTSNGTIHQVTGYTPTKQQIEKDTHLVEENPAQTGANYIKAQQNLPDVIPVGGDPNEAPATPTSGPQP
jgi:hypothetical protein